MKKKIFNQSILFFLLIAMVAGVQTSCKKENGAGAPVIKSIRAINPAPNDSVLTKIGSGQNIVIQGANLKSATAVYFNGFKATFNSALLAENNFVVTVPAINFTKIPDGQLNTIRLITTYGETTFSFPVVPPPPVVTKVSNEYTPPGQEITLYGQYLYLVKSVVFPGGGLGTNIVSTEDGLSCKVTIPTNATTGDIIINTQGGTTSYSTYNDKVTGMLCNFDDINTFVYGSTRTNDATLFPGAQGYYAHMFTGPISTYNYAWYDANRSINLNPVQWVPQANLSDPVSNYVLKFEISVKAAWAGGTLMIRRDENTWVYLARYEPWKSTVDKTFKSDTWYTVTIPLTDFRTKTSNGEGTGTSAPDLATLINATGKRPLVFMYINDTGTPVTSSFDIGVDNIRIVKLKK